MPRFVLLNAAVFRGTSVMMPRSFTFTLADFQPVPFPVRTEPFPSAPGSDFDYR